MKVLLVSPPHADFGRYSRPQLTFNVCRIPNLGLLGIAAYLRQNGHECFIIDGNRLTWRFGNVARATYDEIALQAEKFKPDLVGVSILTADFYEAQKTVRVLRKVLPKTPIVAGGPHCSGEPKYTLKQIPELNGVCVGQGEELCLDLANEKQIEPIMYGYVEKDLDKYPFPAWNLIDANYYAELNHATVFGLLTKSLTVLTSRGCSGNCYFCPWQWNRPYRQHSVEYVLAYLQELKHHFPIDTIAFWDDSLAVDRNRLEQLCLGMIGKRLHLKWTCQIRADQIDSDLLKMLKVAGCVKVSFGAESGNNRILKKLNKGVTVEQNLQAIETIQKAGLHFDLSLMLGVPTETLDEMLDTVNFIERFPHATSIGVGRFCAMPGSPAYQEFVRSNQLNREVVDWSKLGNFSLVDGPYFGDARHEKFRALLTLLHEGLVRQYYRNLRRNNFKAYPEIVNSYYYQESPVKSTLRKLYSSLPTSIRRPVRNVILGGY